MSITGRIKGAVMEISGRVKQVAGKAAGDPDLEQKGREEELTGEARQTIEKNIEQAKGAGQQAAGRVQSTAGAATGDAKTEAQGKLEELQGKIRQKTNE
ncbi:MAG: CsbD family protein [Minicystis sp.]